MSRRKQKKADSGAVMGPIILSGLMFSCAGLGAGSEVAWIALALAFFFAFAAMRNFWKSIQELDTPESRMHKYMVLREKVLMSKSFSCEDKEMLCRWISGLSQKEQAEFAQIMSSEKERNALIQLFESVDLERQ